MSRKKKSPCTVDAKLLDTMAQQESARRVVLDVSLNRRQAEAVASLKLPSTDRQWLHNDANPEIIDTLFGGSKGPGKSYCLCIVGYLYALEVVRFFDLPVCEDVPHVGWIGRKVAAVFTGTTLETWKSVIPSACYRLVAGSEKHPRHIRIAERVAIDYGGLDSRSDLERFNSAEYGLILVDQAEETSKDDVAVLMASRRKRLPHARLGRPISLPYRGLWTANPRNCWLKEEFIDRPRPNKVFVPALPKDNPRLPAGYIKTLEDAFGHRPDLLRAYRDGDWTALSDVDQIICLEWITAARARVRGQPYVKKIVSIDPARFGDDNTVILGFENAKIVMARVLPFCATTQISQAGKAMSQAMGGAVVVVEETGIGGGVIDEMREMGANVLNYNPSAASTLPQTYVNLRAQLWDEVGRAFSTGVFDKDAGAMLCLPEPDDPVLLDVYRKVCEQLTWYRYDFAGGKLKIMDKQTIKSEHNGQSPDYGDAYGQGLWHLRMVEPSEIAMSEMREDYRRLQRAASTDMAASYSVESAFS